MSYKSRLMAGGDQPQVEDLLACPGCGAMTDWATMSRLGARCEKCYASYCANPRPAPHLPKVPSAQDAKAWARALRVRELSGARLSAVQRRAWREALREALREGVDA